MKPTYLIYGSRSRTSRLELVGRVRGERTARAFLKDNPEYAYLELRRHSKIIARRIGHPAATFRVV